jgi:hypothetical protein
MKLDEEALTKICHDTVPSSDHQALISYIGSQFVGRNVSLALSGSNWYRVGGLVDAKGNHISENLREWVESQDVDDVIALYEIYGQDQLFVTKLVGRTLFFVIPIGDDPLAFIQLKVDEIQEVVDRKLFDDNDLADDFEDLIDPIVSQKVEAKQVKPVRYHFRSIRDMREVNFSLDQKSYFKRFYEEWKQSSANDAGHFSEFWVLRFTKYTGAFGDTPTEFLPLSCQKDKKLDIDVTTVGRGQELGKAIHAFDRAVGYPMAWYFFMLTSEKKFHKLAEAVHDDLMGAYAYLPAKDLKILKRWIALPYCF